MNRSIKRILYITAAWLLLAIGGAVDLAGCAATAAPVAPAEPETVVSTPVEMFKASSNCAACHQGMKDTVGNDVSIHTEWQNSVMANAARDPYYFASVRMETLKSPQYAEAIEAKCATCHAPMAVFTNTAEGEQTLLFGQQGLLAAEHPLHDLAVDGVSCSVCHQIPPNPADNLRNSGNLAIADDLTTIERLIYGTFPISEQNVTVMKAASGYTAVQSEHMRESTVCATCHELYLNYIQPDGTLSTGEDQFYEQTPYSEWLASDSSEKSSCIDCHMPSADGAAAISNISPDNLVEPFARHVFTGGNVFMLNLFQQFGEELGIPGSAAGLGDSIQRTEDLLQTETANVFVSLAEQQADTLSINVEIEVLTGHKFPTSFPSRRAWLHVTVSDAKGSVVFESGAFDETGKIFGNENDDNARAYEPHYEIISASDQVQIYEPIMKDSLDEVTTFQMLASGYLKDNRLLPKGFDKLNPPLVSAVIGNALQDATFTGGSDTLMYQVQTNGAQGPFTIQVDLLYQTVGYRWSQNVLDSKSEEAQTFGRMIGQTGNIPVMIASQTVESK